MQHTFNLKWLYAGITLYALLAAACIAKEFYWILVLPAIFTVFLFAFFKTDKIYYLISLVTPLSINLTDTGVGGIGLSLPSEPLIFGIMFLLLIDYLIKWEQTKTLFEHPITFLIGIHLLWFLVSTITSSLFIVSVKQFLARLSFIVVFYFFSLQIFKQFKNFYLFAWLHIAALLIVIAYSITIHAGGNFNQQLAHHAMTPFYNDHTAYAAAIALFLPLTLSFCFLKNKSFLFRFFSIATTIVLVIAIVLSYTRASWLGIFAAAVSYFVFLFRVKTHIVIIGIIILVAGYFVYQNTVVYKFGKTTKYSSSNYEDHIKSITNIKTDASNLERLNRWSCAWRMFLDRPVLGWGPGTYQFQYGTYQKSSEKSIISTNSGDRGNAHSEYLGPLCEQGFLGAIIFIILSIVIILRSSKLIYSSTDYNIRLVATGLFLGLITYWIHGFLNNFLDTEKLSVPFWAFIAALVVLEQQQKIKENQFRNY
ncbi:MAG TPA: O-antigen ligase family protein [Bacteroidia bacterium]|nr:O-antigen ligase family protein [Bacteroidia bacterium]HNU33002.1 O-antigen ligase family protein [Bacteroidia bacterium]